jgi:ubiquinone/menaquinone biosynthesis C-methylase UbiE
MGFYERQILPRLIDRGMRNKVMTTHRPRIPPLARGRVLELGMGSGLNIPYYTRQVEHLFGLEPSDRLLETAAERAEQAPFPVTFIGSGAENIPLQTHSLDTVISTWTLCSIPRLEAALQEVRRVLNPAGRLIFMEHGLAPEPEVARLQQRLLPIFRILAGCVLNREIDRLIRGSGFRFAAIEKTYLEGPRFLSYHYIGEAQPA